MKKYCKITMKPKLPKTEMDKQKPKIKVDKIKN